MLAGLTLELYNGVLKQLQFFMLQIFGCYKSIC